MDFHAITPIHQPSRLMQSEANGSLSFSSSRKESLISWFRKNSKVSWVALGQEQHQDGRESRQSKPKISERVFTLDKSGVRKGKERFRWRRSRFRRLSRVSPEVAVESSDRCPGPRLPNNISGARHLHNHYWRMISISWSLLWGFI